MRLHRLPLLLSLVALWAQADSGKLKALYVICDAYESDENNAIADSVRVDLGTMTKLTHALEEAKVMPVEKTVLQGKKASSKGIWKAVNALQVGPDDTLLFYFSGHGANDHQKSLLFATDEEDVDRGRLEKELLAKHARLTIILTDACNSYLDSDKNSRSFFAAPRSAPSFPDEWRALFVTQRGVVHLAAASPGEYAWSDNDSGGTFTHALVEEGLLKHPGTSWADLFEFTKQRTQASFNGFSKRERAKLKAEGVTSQTPKAYQLTVQDAAGPAPAQPTPPSKPVEPTPAQPGPTGVLLANGTGSAVTFLHDLNGPKDTWSDKRVKEYRLGKGKSQSLPAPATIGWLNGEDSVVRELAAGSYHFEQTDDGLVLAEVGAAAPARGDDKQTDKQAQKLKQTHDLFVGTWRWEEPDQTVTTELRDDGSYVDTDQKGKKVERGHWDVVSEKTSKGKTRTYLSFSAKDSNGTPTDYRYRFKLEADDTISLVLKKTLQEGKAVRLDDDSTSLDDAVMMYRKR